VRTRDKVGLVVGGYVLALLFAGGSVAAYISLMDSPDRQASSGMSAFSDALLFLALFGAAAVPPTGAALYFARPYHAFWRALSVAAIAITTTGLAAVGVLFADWVSGASAGAPLESWSPYAVLRILVAPLVALAFLLSGLFAPLRPAKVILWGATFIEAAAFTSVVLTWLIQLSK
jgi:hypothetical protein